MTEAAVVQPTPLPFYIVLALYLGMMAIIGIYASRGTKSINDFFVLSGKAGALVTGIAYFSTQFSMGTFLGVPGTIYKTGYAGMAISVPGATFCMIIPALIVGRRLIKLGHNYNFLTMSDYLSDRYGSRSIGGILAVLMAFILVPAMGAQIIGAGVIVNVFTGLPASYGIIGFGIIVILYCMSGGMKGAMFTDVIQGSLMILTALVTFVISVTMGGGFANINQVLQAKSEAFLTFPGANGYMPFTFYLSNILLWSLFTIGQPQLFTKFFAMKNHKVMFRAVLLGTFGMWFSATLIEWSGVNAITFIQNLEVQDQVVPIILQRGLHPILASVLIAGIVAAGMSTIDALLVVSTGAVTRDIYQKMINKNASDEQVMKLSRIVTVIIGVAVIIFGVNKPGSIFEINLFSFTSMAVFIVPVIVGMYWKRATLTGAIAAVAVGEVLIFIFTMVKPAKAALQGTHALLPATAVALVVMLVVSLVTKPPESSVIHRHFAIFQKNNV